MDRGLQAGSARLPSNRTARWALAVGVLLLLTFLSACGFRLQGTTPLPFDTLLVEIPANSQFGASVRRTIRAYSPETEILDPDSVNAAGEKPAYDAKLVMVNMTRNQREVSLNPQGRVEEYELTLTATFRLETAGNEVILPDVTLRTVRDLPYDDNVIQAKESETAVLFAEMQQSLVGRLVRRISAPDVHEAYERILAEREDTARHPQP